MLIFEFLRDKVNKGLGGKKKTRSINDAEHFYSLLKKSTLALPHIKQLRLISCDSGVTFNVKYLERKYKLTRKPSEYKVGEILRVAEGDLNIIDCIKDYDCPRKKYCKTYSFWGGLDKVINEYVDSFTLEELLKK